MKFFKSLGCLVILAILAAVGVTGSGLVLKGDPAAFLPKGFVADQMLRTWAKELGLIPAPTTAKTAASLPKPGVRPIIFLPGILGSYLVDATAQQAWPQAQGLANCLYDFTQASAACDWSLVSEDAFTPQGTPASSVRVAEGPTDPIDPALGTLPPGDVPLGGVLSVTQGTHFETKTEHWYDITAENVEASGYTVVQPDDDAGIKDCAATLRCFIPVGLDWRQSAAYNANLVLNVIDNVIALTGADRVDILAHSQGGLVANAVVHDARSVGKIYRIVTLGTPYLGAPKVLSALLFAEPCEVPVSAPGLLQIVSLGIVSNGCAIDQGVVQKLVENYPGVAELLPSDAYYAAYPSMGMIDSSSGASTPLTAAQALQAITQTLATPPQNSALVPRDASLVSVAEQFHDAVDEWSPTDPTVGLLRMVGYDASGPSAACNQAPCTAAELGSYSNSATIVGVDTNPASGYRLLMGSGDGTVPLFSANLYNPISGLDDRGGAADMYWCAISHNGLAQSTAVWLKAAVFLIGTANDTSDTVGQACLDGGDGSLTALGLVA